VRLVLRYFAAASAAAALAVGMSGTAHADDGQIMQVVAADGKVRVVFGAPGLADGESLEPSTIKLRVDHQLLQSTGKLLGTGDTRVNRAALLVIDTSGSMGGPPLAAAKAAADEFLASVPDDVQVGLVSFAEIAALRLPPTKNRDAVRAAVGALAAGGDTALYDGLSIAINRLTSPEYSDAVRSIVLLTDGEDRGSGTDLASVLSKLEESGIGVDAVAFRTTKALPVLHRIVETNSGRLSRRIRQRPCRRRSRIQPRPSPTRSSSLPRCRRTWSLGSCRSLWKSPRPVALPSPTRR
jgi:tight adherence protein B